MEVREFGKENRRKIVLIPGNMMNWRQFENVIPFLEKYIQDNLDDHVDLIFGESFGSAAAGTLFHRQRVQSDSLIPHNQYRLFCRIRDRKELPLLLKLYTRSDDESLTAQF